jgi:hypothetical protein
MDRRWIKSTYSAHCHGGTCVEVRYDEDGGTVHVRNSRVPDGPVVTYADEEWDAFLARVKNGEYNRAAPGGPEAPDTAEVAFVATTEVRVRNTGMPGGPVAAFTSAEWDAFLAGAKDGEFDRDRVI